MTIWRICCSPGLPATPLDRRVNIRKGKPADTWMLPCVRHTAPAALHGRTASALAAAPARAANPAPLPGAAWRGPRLTAASTLISSAHSIPSGAGQKAFRLQRPGNRAAAFAIFAPIQKRQNDKKPGRAVRFALPCRVFLVYYAYCLPCSARFLAMAARASLRERLIRPCWSMSVTITMIGSPTATTSSTCSTR